MSRIIARRLKALAAIVTILLLMGLPVGPVSAANPTIAVNSTIDAPDADPGDGACETAAGNGVCTLRAAVMEANAFAGADTIDLDSADYVLSIPPGNEPDAATGDLNVSDDLTIVGTGVPGTTIKATATNWHDAHNRILTGSSGSFNVTVKDLMLTNGHEGFGGAMLFSAGHTVVLDGVHVSDNGADGLSSGSGGGIYTFGASLTIINSTFTDNLAGIAGGAAITTSGDLTITDSEFKGNVSLARAGAILVVGRSTTSISRTEISFNTAAKGGGAIEVGDGSVLEAANVTVTNSTISNNSG